MDLSFSIAVNSDKSENELLDLICEKVSEANRDRGYVQVFSNVLKFERNADFDPERCDDSPSAWEFYRYDCDVFPVAETSTEAQQEVAAKLLAVFREVGADTNLLAEFEVQY